jgi:hypothetical protein
MPEQSIFDRIPHKDDWAAALRSGKYKQARGSLKRGGGYCCLAVWCLIAGQPMEDRDGSDCYTAIKNHFPTGARSQCIQMNDRLLCDFSEIADVIEGKVSFEEMRATKKGLF